MVEAPVLDALEPEIDRLVICVVDLSDGYAAGSVSQDNVACVVAVARNLVAIIGAGRA